MQSEYVIEMLNIRKEFPGIVANDDITLQLKRGEIHALLGENGAGKSTFIKVIMGVHQAEEGEMTVDGRMTFTVTELIEGSAAQPINRYASLSG